MKLWKVKGIHSRRMKLWKVKGIHSKSGKEFIMLVHAMFKIDVEKNARRINPRLSEILDISEVSET